MLGEEKSGMHCVEFDALLTEALDGALRGERLARFGRHRETCAACDALYQEAEGGLAWLRELEEVDPPRNLVHNILAMTSGAAAQAALKPPLWMQLRDQARAVFAPVLTPRFAMSMGMAFFSITLVLNMAQIRIKDLTPHNLSHTFYSSENKVMKYYENMRLVYEIESRVRDLRNASEEQQREREEQDRKPKKNNDRTQQNQNSTPERMNTQKGLVVQLPAAPRSSLRYVGLAMLRRNS